MAASRKGVGQAMWEQCYVEPSTGQPLSGSFMDYGMPHGHTLPSFKCEIVEVLSPTNPLGSQGRRRRRHHAGARGHHQRHLDALRDSASLTSPCRRRRTPSGKPFRTRRASGKAQTGAP
jgi:hypothetical protein